MSTTYGEVLGFRGFAHAPTREAGVVCLFGAVAAELGFLIEGFRLKYPDVEAKRLVMEADVARWEPCRIEFEFRSKNFLMHNHPVEGVDLIVCWEHDWPEAPVDVLELRWAVGAIRAAEAEGSRFALSRMFYKGGPVKWSVLRQPPSEEALRNAALNRMYRGK